MGQIRVKFNIQEIHGQTIHPVGEEVIGPFLTAAGSQDNPAEVFAGMQGNTIQFRGNSEEFSRALDRRLGIPVGEFNSNGFWQKSNPSGGQQVFEINLTPYLASRVFAPSR